MRIERRGKPKARPRVTEHGTFMPKDYQLWRRAMIEELRIKTSARHHDIEQPVRLVVSFGSDHIELELEPIHDERPKHMRRSDLDNLVGAVMEVLQDSGILVDDKWVHEIHAWFVQPGEE